MTTRGFTSVELLVACSVLSIALLGVQELFRHAMDAESRASTRWSRQGQADALANRWAAELENIIEVLSPSSLVLETRSDGGELIFRTPRRRILVLWRRDSDNRFVVERQRQDFSGRVNLTLPAEVPPEDADSQWDVLTSTRWAERLDEVKAEVASLKNYPCSWEDRWNGAATAMALRITVTIGAETAQRVVAIRAEADRLETGR